MQREVSSSGIFVDLLGNIRWTYEDRSVQPSLISATFLFQVFLDNGLSSD